MAVVGGRAFVDCRSLLSGLQASRGTHSGLALKLDYAAICQSRCAHGLSFSLTGISHSFFFHLLQSVVSCFLSLVFASQKR